ncbi:MAG: radical SAM protein, partial [Deltaproteobacteria bacterium]
FCPNNAMQRNRLVMSDDLFEKILDDCRAFRLPAIEPFLNGEPFVDPKIMNRMELIRRKLPDTKLRIYTNGYGLTPDKIDALEGLGVDHLYVSLNTLDAESYTRITGLNLERTLANLEYLTAPERRSRVARRITFRITRTAQTTVEQQRAFVEFCRRRGVRPFIVGLFNYMGAIPSHLPVPAYPCEHIDRLDILSSGTVTLCCMDHEGRFAWGDVRQQSVLEIFNGPRAKHFRRFHRSGRRRKVEPCNRCNVFWPCFKGDSVWLSVKFALQAGAYFVRYRPVGVRPAPADA